MSRNAKVAVDRIAKFLRDECMEQASVNHIAAQFKAATRGDVPFIMRDISDARRLVQSQPLTQPFKEILVETKKVIGLASGMKPLPIEIKPGLIALAPQPPPVVVKPPPPVIPPKPAPEPRLLLAPSGNIAACSSGNLSEAVDELSQQERCDPTAIVVYRPVKVRVQRLVEVVEE